MYTKGDTHDYFVEQYKEMHTKGYTGAYRISPTYSSRDSIKKDIEKYECKTLLDFGCAQAVHWTETDLQDHFGIEELVLYDPAIEKYNNLPDNKFDAVFCVDVMEHIPEDSIDYIVNQVVNRAEKLAYFKITVALASTYLPDGQNVHISVHDSQWWRDRIAKHKREGLDIMVNRVVV